MPQTNAQPPALPLRIVIVNPDSGLEGEERSEPALEARNRALRIALLEAGYNLVAVLPVDAMVTEHIRHLQPDMVIVDAHSGARDAGTRWCWPRVMTRDRSSCLLTTKIGKPHARPLPVE